MDTSNENENVNTSTLKYNYYYTHSYRLSRKFNGVIKIKVNPTKLDNKRDRWLLNKQLNG